MSSSEIASCSSLPSVFSRRSLVKAGVLGLSGGGLLSLDQLLAHQGAHGTGTARSVLLIFLSGGLSQLDSFDMKPEGPVDIRGEFRPIATQTPGMQICEHFPRLAQQTDKLALVRSLSHWSNEHNEAHTIMLTGRSELPPGYNAKKPQATDWPCLTSVAGRLLPPKENGLPTAVTLPQRLINMNQGGVVTPGQFGGLMGVQHDPWFVEASPYRGNDVKGAYPDFAYSRRLEEKVKDSTQFRAPVLSLPEGLTTKRMQRRNQMLQVIDRGRQSLESPQTKQLDRHRQGAISLLTAPEVRHAFDVTQADSKVADRYGRNLFGWTLLMARRLLAAGVPVIQANLGNYNTWDLHGGIFRLSRDLLYPPADQAVSALLSDLAETGELQETMVVIAGEFGRTPRIFKVPGAYKSPGRDHWGPVHTAVFAGAGVPGGTIIGASDEMGAYPSENPFTPEDFATTIYHTLGIRDDAVWLDTTERPSPVFKGQPIFGK